MSANIIAGAAMVGLLVLAAALVCLALWMRRNQHQDSAESIRSEADEQPPKVRQPQAYADEVGAKDRAAQAESQVGW